MERKTNKLETILDHDIYFVETDNNGKKQINVQFCYYENGEFDDVVMIQEYIGIRLSIPTTREDVFNAIENNKQCVGCVHKSVAMEELENLNYLPIEEVTESTPCGKYIDMRKLFS